MLGLVCAGARAGRGRGGGHPAAGPDHVAAAAPAEQLHPRRRCRWRHRGRQRRRRSSATATPGTSRAAPSSIAVGPVHELPGLRPVPGRQQRPALPAAGLQRLGRHGLVPQLLRLPGLALPARQNALRHGRACWSSCCRSCTCSRTSSVTAPLEFTMIAGPCCGATTSGCAGRSRIGRTGSHNSSLPGSRPGPRTSLRTAPLTSLRTAPRPPAYRPRPVGGTAMTLPVSRPVRARHHAHAQTQANAQAAPTPGADGRLADVARGGVLNLVGAAVAGLGTVALISGRHPELQPGRRPGRSSPRCRCS